MGVEEAAEGKPIYRALWVKLRNFILRVIEKITGRREGYRKVRIKERKLFRELFSVLDKR